MLIMVVQEFLPGKIHEKKESNDLIEIKADLKVGKKMAKEWKKKAGKTGSSVLAAYK